MTRRLLLTCIAAAVFSSGYLGANKAGPFTIVIVGPKELKLPA